MPSQKIVELLYVHSPITYSIGRHLFEHGHFQHELLVVCGRKTAWDGPHLNVENDGIWNIGPTCDYLEKVCGALKEMGDVALDLYVPHSGFLVGKLFGISGVVRRIHYLEEGHASYDPKHVVEPWGSPEIDIGLLTRELERRGIIDTLKLDRERLADLNQIRSMFFDVRHPAYAGCYAVSDNAFPLMTNLTVLPLPTIDIIPEGEQIWLCMLPCLVNFFAEHKNDKPLLDKILYGLLMMLRLQSALVRNAGGALIIKFHPADDAYFNDAFKADYYRYGTPYSDFFEMNGFKAGYEPGLYNFSKFIVYYPSSATLYIKKFQRAEDLVSIKLD